MLALEISLLIICGAKSNDTWKLKTNTLLFFRTLPTLEEAATRNFRIYSGFVTVVGWWYEKLRILIKIYTEEWTRTTEWESFCVLEEKTLWVLLMNFSLVVVYISFLFGFVFFFRLSLFFVFFPSFVVLFCRWSSIFPHFVWWHFLHLILE